MFLPIGAYTRHHNLNFVSLFIKFCYLELYQVQLYLFCVNSYIGLLILHASQLIEVKFTKLLNPTIDTNKLMFKKQKLRLINYKNH